MWISERKWIVSQLELNYNLTLFTTWCSETCYPGITSACCTKTSHCTQKQQAQKKPTSINRCSSKQADKGLKSQSTGITNLDITGAGTSEKETHQEQRRWRAPLMGYREQKLYSLWRRGMISNPRRALLPCSRDVCGKNKVDGVERDW